MPDVVEDAVPTNTRQGKSKHPGSSRPLARFVAQDVIDRRQHSITSWLTRRGGREEEGERKKEREGKRERENEYVREKERDEVSRMKQVSG